MGYSITEHFDSAAPQKRWGLSSNLLKGILAVAMVLDHCYFYLENMPIGFVYLGRLAAPVFFFFMVEGFFHTHSRKRYLLRLVLSACGMAFGNFILNHVLGLHQKISQNFFFSLALGLAILCVIQYIQTHRAYRTYLLYLPVVIFLCAFMLLTEASVFGIMFTLVFYFCHGHKVRLSIVYLVCSLALTLGLAFGPLTAEYLFYTDPQWMMIFALIPILLYNGTRGRQSKGLQAGFYCFYPLHIWLIYIFKYLVR